MGVLGWMGVLGVMCNAQHVILSLFHGFDGGVCGRRSGSCSSAASAHRRPGIGATPASGPSTSRSLPPCRAALTHHSLSSSTLLSLIPHLPIALCHLPLAHTHLSGDSFSRCESRLTAFWVSTSARWASFCSAASAKSARSTPRQSSTTSLIVSVELCRTSRPKQLARPLPETSPPEVRSRPSSSASESSGWCQVRIAFARRGSSKHRSLAV